MKPIEIVAQVFGILAMLSHLWSFQQKTKNGILAFQLLGSLFFMINYFLLGAFTGALMNIAHASLSLVYLYKEKTHADHIAWSIFFVAMYFAAYALSFTVFGKEPTRANLLIELLPVVGAILSGVVSYRMKDAKMIRRVGILKFPPWMAYNLLAFSIGGILSEMFSLISIIVGMLRLDRGEKANS